MDFIKRVRAVFNKPVNVTPLEINGLRQGMWVVQNGRPAIVAGFEDGKPVLHICDESGHTVLVVKATAQEVRQAKISEIPEPRRNVRNYLQLGYKE